MSKVSNREINAAQRVLRAMQGGREPYAPNVLPCAEALAPELGRVGQDMALQIRVVFTLLRELDQQDAAGWLVAMNPQLGGAAPLDMIADGHGDALIRVLENADSAAKL